MMFSYLLHCVLVTCSDIEFKSCLSNYGTVFRVFALINKRIIIHCVMTNKTVKSECMNPFKHVHIIKGKI